jgi:hypothetical protein
MTQADRQTDRQTHVQRSRLTAALLAAVAGLGPTGLAAAMTVNTDSWNCPWSGTTNWQGVGAVASTAASSCAVVTTVQLSYQYGGNWYANSYKYGSTYVSDSTGLAISEAFTRHQTGVAGYGWGQEEYTWIP